MDTIESRGDSGVSSRASSVLSRQTASRGHDGTLPRMDSRDLLDSRGSVLVSVSTRGKLKRVVIFGGHTGEKVHILALCLIFNV